MTDDILLDTHIALWLGNGDERLRASTLGLIDGCWRRGGTVLISAINAWEIAQLVNAGRINLDRSVDDWIKDFIDRPGMRAMPLSLQAASRSCRLQHLQHRDPADRLLIATAIELACPLITYDARISRFGENHGAHYGFSVGA